MSINHNQKIVHIAAPQDQEIIRLGRKLNNTYIAYGTKGTRMKERQMKQDMNAAAQNTGVLAERSITKASHQYKNESWDLVDAEKEGKVKVADVSEKDLPREMRGMDKKEREAFVKKMAKERLELQNQINLLRKQRSAYIAKKRKEMSASNTLDKAMIITIKKQALKKEFKNE